MNGNCCDECILNLKKKSFHDIIYLDTEKIIVKYIMKLVLKQ